MSGAPTLLVPETAGEVASVLREALDRRAPIVPLGGGTHRSSMPSAPMEATRLDLRGLRKVVAYDPGDLTLSVEAGATLGEIDALLAANGHELALDAEEPERATIGGLLSAGFPTRAGAMGRALRDQVLGTRVAQLDGTLTRSGGRVVKNVTGYDLEKLFIGSRGTLAVLVEVALRVHPRPIARAAVAAACADFASAQRLALRWRDPQPSGLDVLDAASARGVFGALPPALDGAPQIALAIWRGSPAVVAAHAERALSGARELGLAAERLEGSAEECAQRFAVAPRRVLAALGGWVLALRGRPSRAVATHAALERALVRVGLREGACIVSEAAGSSTRVLGSRAPSRETFGALLSALAAEAGASECSAHLEIAPPELHAESWEPRHAALLPMHGGLAVMRRVKAAFDEHGLLHPGAWPMLDASRAIEATR